MQCLLNFELIAIFIKQFSMYSVRLKFQRWLSQHRQVHLFYIVNKYKIVPFFLYKKTLRDNFSFLIQASSTVKMWRGFSWKFHAIFCHHHHTRKAVSSKLAPNSMSLLHTSVCEKNPYFVNSENSFENFHGQ